MNNKKEIRTRYAPSPTGYLHIGGARTALFCFLFAKHNNGKFIFRLEDTDVARNVENGEKSQLENLSWLGIEPDESPLNPNPKYGKYRQSEKLERYLLVANQMIENNLAYIAYDLPKELEQQKIDLYNKYGFDMPLQWYRENIKPLDEELEYYGRLITRIKRYNVQVGDGVTICYYTDREAGTIIKRTKNIIDKTGLLSKLTN